MIVADCNLAAYLMIEGEHTAAAETVFAKDPDWCAPWLIRSEFMSVLAQHMRHRSLPLASAHAAMSKLDTLYQNRFLAVNAADVLALVEGTAVSAYDAEYVSLAQRLSIPLVTFDTKLTKAAPNHVQSAEHFLKGARKGSAHTF